MRTNQTILDSTTLTIELDGDNLVLCVRGKGADRSRCVSLPSQKARMALAYAQSVLDQGAAEPSPTPGASEPSAPTRVSHVEMGCESGVFEARWPDPSDQTLLRSIKAPISEIEGLIDAAREAIRADRKEQN